MYWIYDSRGVIFWTSHIVVHGHLQIAVLDETAWYKVNDDRIENDSLAKDLIRFFLNPEPSLASCVFFAVPTLEGRS